MRSAVLAARNRIDYPVRYTAGRRAEPLVNKILVKLSPNELKQLPSQLGEAIVRVPDEKKNPSTTDRLLHVLPQH